MATRTQSVVSPERDWKPQPKITRNVVSKRQTAEARLHVYAALYSWRPASGEPPTKYVLVSLEGSSVNPTISGSLEFDATNKRGWYTESADVYMFWADQAAVGVETTLTADPGADGTTLAVASAAGFPSSGRYKIKVGDEVMLVTDGHGTTSWTVVRAQDDTTKATHAPGATVRSLGRFAIADDQPGTSGMQAAQSTTSAIDFNLTAGAFGSTPTGGASVGGSIGHSWSENISDFKIKNMSAGANVLHSYRLAGVRGATYEKATDLYASIADDFRDRAWLGELYELPDKATTNMSLLSQALFDCGDISEVVNLNIYVAHHLAMVEIPGSDLPVAHTKVVAAKTSIPIDFSIVR